MVFLNYVEALGVIKPLILYAIGIFLYTYIVYKMYKIVARKNIFKLELRKYAYGKERIKNMMKIGLYVIEHLILFPLLIIVWFLLFSGLLTLVIGDQTITTILLISMAVVTAARIGAYVKEEMAQEISKTIPMAILGIFILRSRSFNLDNTWSLIEQIPAHWDIIAYYLLFSAGIEIIARLFTITKNRTIESIPTEQEIEEEIIEEEKEKKEKEVKEK